MHEPRPDELNLEELVGLTRPEQVTFDLLSDSESIQINPEGFVVHHVRRAVDQQLAEKAPGLFGLEEGRLTLGSDDQYHLKVVHGMDLGVMALVAAHMAVRTNHDVVIDWGDFGGDPMVMMSMRPYVDALRSNPDSIYAPEYESFNLSTIELYGGGRMEMPENMRLSPPDQLIVAHAAHNLVKDFEAGAFPDEPRSID